MDIRFIKMHALGNDYVYIDCFKTDLGGADLSRLARKVSLRRFSVGSDGLILIQPSDICDVKMRIFNADGSEGKTCGNGIRCAAMYAYESGICAREDMTVQTSAGVNRVRLKVCGGKVESVCVDMGKAVLEPSRIPVVGGSNKISAEFSGKNFELTCVSMGNPHAAAEVKSLGLDVARYGRAIEKSRYFPDGVNVEFIKILSPRKIQMRVWERGSGETLACGTGACAAAVCACIGGKCAFGEPITVVLRGGKLKITVQSDLRVFMEGGAERVFEGVFRYED